MVIDGLAEQVSLGEQAGRIPVHLAKDGGGSPKSSTLVTHIRQLQYGLLGQLVLNREVPVLDVARAIGIPRRRLVRLKVAGSWVLVRECAFEVRESLVQVHGRVIHKSGWAGPLFHGDVAAIPV